MPTSYPPGVRPFLGLVLILGCLPAFIVLLIIRFENSEIFVFGQNLGPYSTGQLLAGVLSPSAPILLLIPLAIIWISPKDFKYFFAMPILSPLAFLGPTLVTATFVGASGLAQPIQALLLISIFLTCFCLWLRVLDPFFPKPLLLLLYGALWASSSFLDYVVRYVVPHQDSIAVKGVGMLTWALPQLGTLLSTTDELLLGGGWAWKSILPTLIQMPLLLGVLFLLARKSKSSEHQDSA